jgi:2-polyprenyl-3-methyl-5-hydroxy-6-metoxy-1,4-benzoquinol methylase
MINRLRWTPELVKSFWDGLTETRLLELGFSKLAGQWLLRALRFHLTLGGRHLDFGSGDGHFAQMLAAAGYPAAIYDPASSRVETLRSTLSEMPGFLGIAGVDTTEVFDTVLMIEVIEHVLETELDSTMALLDRLLAPGGTLIITTPNNEDLELEMTYEPVSGTLSHRWQHVRSFTAQSLVELLGRYGFEPITVHQIEFSDRVFSEAGAKLGVREEYENLFNTIRPIFLGAGNSIVFIGRRTADIGDDSAAKEDWNKIPLVIDTATTLTMPIPLGSLAPDSGNSAPAAPGDWTELVIPVEAMEPSQGHCWTVPLISGFTLPDVMEDDRRSRLELYENHLPLGPGHSAHDQIRQVGRGAYSHWSDTLYFSSSDNLPPNMNGRKYVIRFPAPRIGRPEIRR